MLVGICPEVVELLKDKSVNPERFEVLRKMKPMRQIEAAELMSTAGNYTASYAKALLAATRQADLVKSERAEADRRHDGRTDGAHGARDGEGAEGPKDRRITIRRGRAPVGDRLRVSFKAGRQCRNQALPGQHHPEILSEFRAIIAATSLDQVNTA